MSTWLIVKVAVDILSMNSLLACSSRTLAGWRCVTQNLSVYTEVCSIVSVRSRRHGYGMLLIFGHLLLAFVILRNPCVRN